MAETWLDLAPDHPFGLDNLPYAALVGADGTPYVGVRIGDQALDLTAATARLLPEAAELFTAGSLDAFLAAGPETWARVRETIRGWLTGPRHAGDLGPLLTPLARVRTRRPFTVADYVDFYASEHHATNLGRMFRPDQEPLTPNWKHLPIGYHGRSGTVVVSGTDVVRPHGQRRTPDGEIVFGPATRLDIEAELGFVVGCGSELGRSVPLTDLDLHVFGVCLVNDWSARDLQAWEYVPLGPFLGKSFATSMSAWVTPLAALSSAWVDPPARTTPLLPYLDDTGLTPRGLDIELTVRLNGEVVSRPPFALMYWTAAQQLAHLTVNGASLRTGDLFASGTISGPEPTQRGSLIELSWNGSDPITLADGSRRTFLEDGDEVVIDASAPGPAGARIGLGEVRGRVVPAAVGGGGARSSW